MVKKIYVIIEVLLIFFLPVLVYRLGWLPIGTRLYALEIFAATVVVLTITYHIKLQAIGFRLDTFLPAIKLLLPGTLTMMAVLFLFYKFNLISDYFINDWWKNSFFIYYFFIGAPSQEFGYRGYLLHRLQSITSRRWALIILNAVLFAWLHILFQDPYVLIGTFIFGLYLTWVYLKQPNIYASSIAHGLVGATGIILGFF